jgi:hypothetical protein
MQSTTVYEPAVPAPVPEPMIPSEPPKIVTALLTADGVDGRTSSSILINARSDAPIGYTNERAYIKSGGMTNIPSNARVFLKGDGEPSRNEQSADLTMNQANIDRVPVVATTAPMNVRSALVNGYDSQLIPPRSRRGSFAPTQSDVKFKSATTGSSYLEGLNRQSQTTYRPPVVTRTSDPFAPSKMAAHAVSRLLYVDPRSGESFSRDPFAISRKAADAVSLLLIKYTEPKDAVFYLT